MENALSPAPCGCKQEAPYEPKTHVNLRLSFTSEVKLEDVLQLLSSLPKHELAGFEINKW